jgi:hypothetical protein
VSGDPPLTRNDELRALRDDVALLAEAAAGLSEKIHQAAHLADVFAARSAQAAERLDRIAALLPQSPGRPELAKTPESFRQKVKKLRDEKGWGRGRILVFMRVNGYPDVKDWQVKEALAGEKRCASSGPEATVGSDRTRKRRTAQERSEGR